MARVIESSARCWRTAGAHTGRRVTLTPAGKVLVRHAGAILADIEPATAPLTAARTGVSGPLRIGAFPTAVRTLLPAALVALGREHPGLELMVSEMDPAVVPDAVRDRRLVSAGGAGAYGDGLEEDPADGCGVRGDEHPAAGDLGDGLHFCLGDCGADAQDDELDRFVRVGDLL
jgi:hypothetical protein